MSTPEDNPFPRVVDRWEQVLEDMELTAEEYRAAGWETVELHPGDVTPLTYDVTEDSDLGARHGIDVLVPDDEYAELTAAVEDREIDQYEVLRGVDGGIVFTLVILESTDGELAVFVPAYFETKDLDGLREEDILYTYVRCLSADGMVTFAHENPEPFFPEPTELDAKGDAAGSETEDG